MRGLILFVGQARADRIFGMLGLLLLTLLFLLPALR
jgi:hypothetical protein